MYVFGVALLSGLAFGVIPAFWIGRRAPATAIKEGGRGGGHTRRVGRLGNALVIGEVALALMLTVGAGLLLHSFWRLRQVSPGFDSRNVLTVSLGVSGAKYRTGAAVGAFYDETLRRMRALPGVENAAATSSVPLTGVTYTSDFVVEGWPADKVGFETAHRVVTPDYLNVMRGRLARGRPFTAQDGSDAPPVTIMNQALADKYFRGEDPIGKKVAFSKKPDSTTTWYTIVGVAANEHQRTLAAEPQIEFLTPFAQETRDWMTLVIRTKSDPVALGPTVRRVIAEMDGQLAIRSMRTMTDVQAASLARERFLTTLLITFAGVGLALAMVGVFGVMAQLVQRRTREMGIRIALGAQSDQVRWMVVRHGMALIVVGLTLGTGAAMFVTRAMEQLLFQTTPLDPLAFTAVPLLLTLSGVAAAWVPARRASRADPSAALRSD
jgi:putative ABC transport system permease protein